MEAVLSASLWIHVLSRTSICQHGGCSLCLPVDLRTLQDLYLLAWRLFSLPSCLPVDPGGRARIYHTLFWCREPPMLCCCCLLGTATFNILFEASLVSWLGGELADWCTGMPIRELKPISDQCVKS